MVHDTTFGFLIIITLLMLIIVILNWELYKLKRQINMQGGILYGLLEAFSNTQRVIKDMTILIEDIISEGEDDKEDKDNEERRKDRKAKTASV